MNRNWIDAHLEQEYEDRYAIIGGDDLDEEYEEEDFDDEFCCDECETEVEHPIWFEKAALCRNCVNHFKAIKRS